LARFPENEAGTSAAHEDLALRRRREWRRLLLPRALGITALVSGALWVAFSVISVISFSIGITQHIIRVTYPLLVFSSLSLIVVFLIRRLSAEEAE
jgi:hypothetical protein